MEEMIISPCDGVLVTFRIQEDLSQKRCNTFFKIKQKDDTVLEIKKTYQGRISSVEVREGEEVVKGMVLAYVEEYALEI
ncbi:hypothetical protein QNH23_17005 [Siminovitchia fortis]|uniref:Uncharacterized protein n=1 Tax=Siminovitchia fortis TaxID=254758 RepID=A0A443ILF2_9BACI|nr:hypothetical protein [Siminovitchia fortis]RWR06115.1 hypothetical protein D4N35_014605 [Siminovitchia fortis]WHY81548.1 hypothetical protein QNH23_17005 [Siminovitchia fortis]